MALSPKEAEFRATARSSIPARTMADWELSFGGGSHLGVPTTFFSPTTKMSRSCTIVPPGVSGKRRTNGYSQERHSQGLRTAQTSRTSLPNPKPSSKERFQVLISMTSWDWRPRVKAMNASTTPHSQSEIFGVSNRIRCQEPWHYRTLITWQSTFSVKILSCVNLELKYKCFVL